MFVNIYQFVSMSFYFQIRFSRLSSNRERSKKRKKIKKLLQFCI